MSGDWLAATAAHLLRPETYRLMLAPAIADLQHERAGRNRLGHARDCAVIWLTIARGLVRDLTDDAAAIVFSDAARTVWPRVLGFYAVVFIVNAVRRVTQGLRIHTPDMAPGEFNTLPLPQAGDGLEPYLAGLMISIAGISLAYAAVPTVFMFRRRQVRIRAIAIGVLGLALMAYSTARLARPIRMAQSEYATAAIMRGTGLYPANDPLATIIDAEIRTRREQQNAVIGRVEAKAHHWAELASGLSVIVYALIGAAMARGTGAGVAVRFAGIMGSRFVLGFALPYLSLLLWPIYPASVRPFERSLLESQLAFALLPLVACIVLAIPGRRAAADRRPA